MYEEGVDGAIHLLFQTVQHEFHCLYGNLLLNIYSEITVFH